MDIDLGLPEIPTSLATWASVDKHYDEIGKFVGAISDATGLKTSATALLLSLDPAIRALGVDLLGELMRLRHIDVADFLEVTARSISDADEDVRWSAAVSLRHGTGPAIARALIKLTQDPNSDVRFQAVVGLPLASGDTDTPRIRQVLTAALDDWATAENARNGLKRRGLESH